jgi:hypothetical protein
VSGRPRDCSIDMMVTFLHDGGLPPCDLILGFLARIRPLMPRLARAASAA